MEPSPPRSPLPPSSPPPIPIPEQSLTPKRHKQSPEKSLRPPHSASPPNTQNLSSQSTPSKATPKAEMDKKANARRWFAGGKGGQHTAAKVPGSKELPRGAPNCLQSKTFVITGQLESLDRQEADDFVMRHGGTVRTTVSGKTHYLVVGDEPGSSKMERADKFRTPRLTEDELITLVVEQSRCLGVDPWAWKGGAAAEASADQEIVLQPMELDEAAPPPAPPAGGVDRPLPLESLLAPRPTATAFYGADPSASSGTACTQSAVCQAPRYAWENQLWADKYRPLSLKSGMVSPPQAAELKRWLESWQENCAKRPPPPTFKKAALLSGSPGIGKTTTAHLVGRECGYEVVEWNASDKRSKRDIDETILDMVNNTSVKALFQPKEVQQKRCCIVMDEVDGCDRGGVGEVIQMIHRTRVPIICICNDRFHPKVKSLANHCLDLKFNKPNRTQVAAHLQRILQKEGHDMPLPTLEMMVTAYNNDIRSLLNSLQMWFRTRHIIHHDEARGLQANSNKDHEVGMFEAPELFLTPQTPKPTIAQLREIYFTVDFVGLSIQENYVNMRPEHCRSNDERLALLARAADSISLGDASETLVRRDQHWGLSSVGVFQSAIYPSALVRGKFESLRPPSGWADNRLRFPGWLGQNSSRKRNDRMITCIAKAARNPLTGATGSSADLRMYYFDLFTHNVTTPLAVQGKDGIEAVTSFMDTYHLGRDDWEFLQELHQWKRLPLRRAPLPPIDSAVRAAFTRSFNKTHLMSAVKASAPTVIREDNEEGLLEVEEDAASEEGEDLTKDTMIVSKKKAGGKGVAAASSAGAASTAGRAAKKAPRGQKRK
eukprot:GGOE01001442.1.p1 GENE.GGOE01001442.1~~GGOE01001442.1.p1  ORF type:complete len:935 (+),score=193.92 GGOE01001442.1:316-2805(+)